MVETVTLIKINQGQYPVYSCHEMKNSKADLCQKEYITFSGIKLGRQKDINKCASEMIKILKKFPKVASDDWIVVNVSAEIENAAYCIAKEVSKRLNKRHERLYQKIWKTEKYYLDMTNAEKIDILQKNVYYSGTPIVGKKAILIDDGMTTGIAIKINGEVLFQNGITDLVAINYLKVKKSPKNLEKEIGKTVYLKLGVDGLIEILTNTKNPIISRMVSICAGLPDSEIKKIFMNISHGRAKELLEKAKIYAINRPNFQRFIKIGNEMS